MEFILEDRKATRGVPRISDPNLQGPKILRVWYLIGGLGSYIPLFVQVSLSATST